MFWIFLICATVYHARSAYGNGYTGAAPGTTWIKRHRIWWSQREWLYIPGYMAIFWFELGKPWLALLFWIPAVASIKYVVHNAFYLLGELERRHGFTFNDGKVFLQTFRATHIAPLDKGYLSEDVTKLQRYGWQLGPAVAIGIFVIWIIEHY